MNVILNNKKMPKVLFINPAKNYGSTGKIIEQIGLLSKNSGWDPYLLHSSRYDNPSKLGSIKVGSTLSEKWHALMALLFDRHGLHSYQATKEAILKIKELKPDVIHLHNIHGYYINYPLLFQYLKDANVPIVWTLHDCWSFTGHCTYFDMIGCEKWKLGCHHCENLKDYPKSILCDRSAKNYSLKKDLFTSLHNVTIGPVSDWLGQMVAQSYMGKYPVRVLHNGVDLKRFRVLSPKRNDGKFRILGVALGFSGRKGLDDFNKLREILPDNYEITMVGLIGDEINKILPGIRGIARTSTVDELVNLYNEADVYINPTYSDNFPTTNIEALACGTPVITYKTGGSPEAVDSKTGVVIEQGNVTALANAIMQMKDHPLSSADCRKRAEECFDKDKCFEKYIALYEEILRTRS